MSKSREAFDKENPSENQQDYQSSDQLTNDQRTALGGQTNFGIGGVGRESRSDFPRRSTSNRYRQESSTGRQDALRYTHQEQPYSSTQFDRQQSQRRYEQRLEQGRQQGRQQGREQRGGDYNRSTYNRADQYQNRQWTGEDSGDFYSRGISERVRADEYGDHDRSRGYRSREQREYPSNYQSGSRGQRRESGGLDSYSTDYSSQGSRGEPGRERRTWNYDNEFENARDYDRGSRYERDDRQSRRDQDLVDVGFGPYADGTPYGFQPWAGESRPYTVRCRDLMTRDVTTCAPETSLRDVAEMMESENVGSIPVVENGRLIGLVTDRDIVCRVIAEGRDTRATTAREAMTDDLVTCTPDETVIDAIHKMGECQVRRIPVCDPTGKLRGIMSMGDVALEAERDMDVARALEQVSQPSRQASRVR